MVAFDENLLLYAGAALHQLADELHESRAEDRVLLPTHSNCHCVPTAWLRNHVGDIARFWRLGVSCHRVVQLGEEGEEHLRKSLENASLEIFSSSASPEFPQLSSEWNEPSG